MKNSVKIFGDISLNAVILPVLSIFLLQAAVIMYYNQNNLTFTGLKTFQALARAAEIGDANFLSAGNKVEGDRAVNGFLYPAFLSVIYKITGRYNLIPLIYVMSFFVFLFIAAVFYRISFETTGREYAAACTVMYVTAAPVGLAMFSGADTVLSCALAALNAYHIYFGMRMKTYRWAWITTALLCLVNFTSLILGLASAAFLLLKAAEKSFRKDMPKTAIILYSALFVVFSAALIFIFADNTPAAVFSQGKLSETKTFRVDTFFSSGFLWSKALPPFLGILLFISLFGGIGREIREGRPGFAFYSLAVCLAAFLVDFFSVFSENTDPVLLMGPFYFIIIINAAAGLKEASVFAAAWKKPAFSPKSFFLCAAVLTIALNFIFLFSRSVERANTIKLTAGNKYVEKFIER